MRLDFKRIELVQRDCNTMTEFYISLVRTQLVGIAGSKLDRMAERCEFVGNSLSDVGSRTKDQNGLVH